MSTNKRQKLAKVTLIVAHDELDANVGPTSAVELIVETIYAGTDYAHDLHVVEAYDTPLIVLPESLWRAEVERMKATGQ
jgi:hypothetical protein